MNKATSEFVSHLSEVFEDFGPISARRMFGGYGIYHGDLMFGLVADDVLYLKADASSQPEFARRELQPFTYVKAGKTMNMSYFAAPEEVYEDRAAAKRWAVLAYEAALRNRPRPRR